MLKRLLGILFTLAALATFVWVGMGSYTSWCFDGGEVVKEEALPVPVDTLSADVADSADTTDSAPVAPVADAPSDAPATNGTSADSAVADGTSADTAQADGTPAVPAAAADSLLSPAADTVR